MRRLLELERGVSFAEAGDLRLLAKAGQLENRPITLFRVFDQAVAMEAGEDTPNYDDLSPELILHSGYIEADTAIVLNDSD